MRAGVCWSAVALLVLVTATSALRTFQVENSRNSRRLSNFDNSGSTSTTNIDEVQPTFRPRNHRRREEPSPSTPRDVTRKRSRNKLSDTHISSTVIELSQVENERNERFDSRRTNRIRSRPIENESSATSFASRESSSNNKVRQSNRRPQYVTTQAPLEYSSSYSNDNRVRDVSLRKNKIISSETSSTLSSPISEASTKDINIKRTQPTQTQSYQAINDNKTEVIAPDFYDFSRTVPKEEAISTSQFKRRSSTARITESVTITTPKSTRRGRVNTRTNLKLEDMASSGATNTLTISEKKPTVETKEDTRNSRKLRYRTRFSEIDTNITGEGLTTSNEEVNHKKRKNSSQAEIRTSSSASAENKIQGNTEGYPSKSVTNKVMRVVRRPYSKEKESLVTVPKVKTSEEIGDDDNYPETFKALIQAKNASTQESSPPSESLSVKASHKAINTITQPSQLSNVSRDSNNTTLLRSKLNRKENESNIGTSENNKIEFATDSPTSKSQEYRLRGSHSSKSRKLNPLNASFVTKSSITSAVTEKPLYKFTRKLKTTTEVSSFANTTKSKTYQNSQPLQDSMTRTSYYSRKTFGKHSIRSTESTTTKENLKTLTSSGKVNNTVKLPRTSYYSRLRNKNSIVSTTDFAINETPIAEKKTENTAEMPLIFTLLNKSGKTTLNNNSSSEKPEEHVEPFLIKVSSKESHENNTENEIINKAEESENVPIMNLATTQKYHANFKERSLSETEKKIYNVPAATPPIRNIQTRKYARKIIKPKGKIETTSKDRTSRKYSDAFSKTTEASTNGIMSETEKPKSKFSSKYRAQYIDKPFYKPTVPTVTPTTVVGEEIDLGPDMNAISFTQTRNAISSADLRLSESVAKPSHIMNVEASNHSPSVTVSIFDALAEILTSTPRIQISTTTEVPKQFFTDSVTKQTLNGVSNNNNVNSDTDASSQSTNTASTISISTITPVQITDQTTPIVLNRLPVVENILPSLKTDGVKLSSASTPPITFTPSSTTPISVRRPFAIKVLYSDTERLTDNPTSSELSTNWSTTDNPEMTKQIRTEKPGDGEGNTVFKFIPIDEVTVPPQNTNVLKIVSTKIPKINSEKEVQIVMAKSVTEVNLSVPQMQTNLNESNPTISRAIASTTYETVTNIMNDQSSPRVTIIDTPIESKSENVASTTSFPSTAEKSIQSMTTEKDETFVQPSMHTIITPEFTPTELPKISATSSSVVSSTLEPATTSITTPSFELSNQDVIGENVATISPMQLSEKTVPSTTNTSPIASKVQNDIRKAQEESVLLHSLLEVLSTTIKPISSQKNDEIKLLQSLLLTTSQKLPPTNQLTNLNKATTMRSIEEELKQFKKDTELLKVLLQATGKNPAALNIPGIGDIKLITTSPTTKRPITTTASTTTTIKTTPVPTITTTAKTTSSITDEIRKLKEDTQLLQALLQATGQNVAELNLPKISGITSNVRIASNPLTTSYESPNTPTTNYQPVYTTIRTKQILTPQTEIPQTTTSVITNLQEQKSTVTADIGISTTFLPVDRSLSTTTNPYEPISTLSNKRASGIGQITTERPSTSTFSVEEDLEFLKNLKTVLNTNTNTDDPEAALANRVIALAVERSLNEIQTEKQADSSRAGKNINPDFENSIRITTPKTTTTTKISTTTFKPTEASTQITPSIEDDIKQFEEDTKLLQALIKATGQDPSKFNIPTLPTINKPGVIQSSPTTAKPSGIKIAVKDNLKSVQDDAQLLQTLIKLKDAQETTTQKNKLAITGQSPDEALQKLIQKAKPTVMASEATKSSISLSTEYGNSNDALLAALLKEQGFGPTTASSIDEQARLAALLNQVVVAPKARRTTTLPPPPPAPRRPILDGIAWLWQQWRDTAPGANSDTTRTNHRQPATPTRQSAAPSAAASSGVNWFGSGPFVGNADERPSSNRIPLEPPRAVVAEQAPGRGQLVSAAINVTRAFSQFLGAAIQGAAQTVQNVIRAGQKAATDVYTTGSG